MYVSPSDLDLSLLERSSAQEGTGGKESTAEIEEICSWVWLVRICKLFRD